MTQERLVIRNFNREGYELFSKLINPSLYEGSEETTSILENSNPILRPDNLKEIPGYSDFLPYYVEGVDKGVLWIRNSAASRVSNLINQGRVPMAILYSGLVASGKDTVRKLMEDDLSLCEHIVKPVSATTREKRTGEKDGVDYMFYSTKDFLEKVLNNELVEAVPQYDHLYGTSKDRLSKAILKNECFLFSQVEVSGWAQVSRFIGKVSPKLPIISTFILPERTYSNYRDFLRSQRDINEFVSRSKRAVWELEKAGKEADLIVVNPTDENNPGKAASESLISLLSTILENKPKIVNFS